MDLPLLVAAELKGLPAEFGMLGVQFCVAAIRYDIGGILGLHRLPRGCEVGVRLHGLHAGVAVEGRHHR